MSMEHELIPGVAIGALGSPERLALWGLRLIAAGRGDCPHLDRSFEDMLGSQGVTAVRGLTSIAQRLPKESGRPLTLGWLCVRGVTWDEAAILALLEGAQRSDVMTIDKWFRRLSIELPSPAIQRGLAWASASFSLSDCGFDPDIANLSRATRPGTVALIRHKANRA